jgi:hypothetical protein
LIVEKSSASSFNTFTGSNFKNVKIIVWEEEGISFPIYTGATVIEGGEKILTFSETKQSVGSRFSSQNKSIIYLGFNIFDEVKYLLSQGQPLEYGSLPTLDIHIAILRKLILNSGLTIIEIPPVSYGSSFFVCLTHDVDFAGIRYHKFDHTLAGFLYRALLKSVIQFCNRRIPLKSLFKNWSAVAKLPLVFVGLKKDYWNSFKDYCEIEKEYRSTFFIVPYKNRPGSTENGKAPSARAVKYHASDLKSEIDYLLDNGCEIGVHGIDSWIEQGKAKEELKKIESLARRRGLGVRMHWLYFNYKSISLLECAGYKYDSTWGYNEQAGYRAGTLQAYKPPQAKVLIELPMHIMDTALFYPVHLGLSFEQGLELIKKFTDNAINYGGVLTLNWHDRSIAPERLWDDVYREALQHFRSQGASFMTAGAMVDWFKKRRSIVFEKVIFKGDTIKVKVSSKGGKLNLLDKFFLRVHKPANRCYDGSHQTLFKSEFQDYPLEGNYDIKVVI